MGYRAVILACCISCGRIDFGAHNNDAGFGGDSAGDGIGVTGDGAAANDPDGFWVVTSAHVIGEDSDRLRSDLVNGVRGDLTITTGAPHPVQYRVGPLMNELMIAYQSNSGTLALDPDGNWVMSITGVVGVYAPQWLDASDVALTIVADPRNTNISIDQFLLTRGTPPDPTLVKNWTVSGIQFAGFPLIPSSTCAPFDGEYDFATGTSDISSSFIVTLDVMQLAYSDSGCTNPAGSDQSEMAGYLETDPGVFRSWFSVIDNGMTEGGIAFSGTAVKAGSGWTFTQTACFPTSTCTGVADVIELE